jgi:methylenetetrahydrofolate dehydrogenase (NADP+)/methenyltetrahydrofolate cyclohydrolase
MELLSGKDLSKVLKDEIKEEVATFTSKGKRKPHLAAILVGEDGASQTYVKHKMKACEYVGFQSSLIRKPSDISEAELLELVQQCNEDEGLDGFIVQLPLPDHINPDRVIHAILPEKDVDGFHPVNIGNMVLGHPAYLPATPAGIMEMLRRHQIDTSGKKCVVLGRSNIVGRPISIMLSGKGNPGNATVTVCHSRTPADEIKAYCQEADIIVVALGKPGFLTGDMVKKGVVVIDVGTTRVSAPERKRGWRLAGDADFDSVAPKSSYITPVPGGVGPMTVTMLIKNTLNAYKLRQVEA